MIGKNELAEAARYNDAEVEGDAESFAHFFTNRSIDLEGMVYVAQQRALRAVMTSFMGVHPSELNQSLSAPLQLVDVPDNLRSLLPVLAASVVDGVAMMARAQEIAQRTQPETFELPQAMREEIKAALEGEGYDDAAHNVLAGVAAHFGIEYEAPE